MNILLANWTWHPSGGDWTYVDNLCRLYAGKGHSIVPFSMDDSRNSPTPYASYFVEHIDYKEMQRDMSVRNGIKVLTRSIYSLESRRKLQQLLANVHIDLAHLHNIHHHISPSIIPVLKDAGVPIIWTLHDFSIICPENSFYSNGQVCERCKNGKFYACTVNRCKKESYLASFMASLENYCHRLLAVYEDVDFFLCPSDFLRRKFLEFGFPTKKFIVTRLCYDTNIITHLLDDTPAQAGDYILYVGRIERIKGWATLLSAMQQVPDVPLYIVGDGTESDKLRQRLMTGYHQVQFLGHRNVHDVLSYIRNSLFTVCPSEWYENFPFSIIEAMLLAKPVVGARIGGIPELVIDGETGYTFCPGDPNDLASAIKRMLGSRERIPAMGENARNRAREMTSFENHYDTLTDVFKRLGLAVNQ